jgi:hypothetical protein
MIASSGDLQSSSNEHDSTTRSASVYTNGNSESESGIPVSSTDETMIETTPEYSNDIDDTSFPTIDGRVAMPYDHPGIDCNADRVKLSLSELQQYVLGEIILDDMYVEQKRIEQKRDSNNEGVDYEEETLFWNQFWEQRKRQRELLRSGVRVVLNENGQLVPAEDHPTADVGEGGAVDEENNNNAPRAHAIIPPVVLLPFLGGVAANNNNNNNGMDQLLEVEEERQLRERQRETEAIIARHVQRLRTSTNIDATDFEVVRMFPEAATARNALPTNNLTFRRICIAVLAVAASFVCIMIQSLPPPYLGDDREASASSEMETDHLMYDLFDIRDWNTHSKYCGNKDGHFSKERVKIETVCNK